MKDAKQTVKLPVAEQVSAGGAAFRFDENGAVEVAIIAAKPSLRWQLPKGLIDAGETEQIAALREVREEAGIECEVLEKIETVEYWYVGDNWGKGRTRFHKLVHFFLLRYVAGDVADHDHEVAEARWVKIADAIEMLAFKSEKDVIERASAMISKLSATNSDKSTARAIE